MNEKTHMERIASHYAHAKEKHPHFADVLISTRTAQTSGFKLAEIREIMDECVKRSGRTYASDVLLCELWEVAEAYAAGRRADAIEECYDAVAVLLRMADMIAAEGGAK